jgi:PQQ-like domain
MTLEATRTLIQARRWQQAELLLLSCRESTNPVIAATATRLHAETLAAAGLSHDAGRLLAELADRYAAIDVGDGQNARDYLAGLPRDTAVWGAYVRGTPPAWSGAGAKISENRVLNEALQAVYNGNGVHPLTVPRTLPFDLFDKKPGAAGHLVFVDRQTGIEQAETIQLPGRYSYPVNSMAGHVQHSYVGRFLPVGGTGAVHGLSLLERKLLWTTPLKGLETARDLVQIGPAGPRFCACQCRQHLAVLDPRDGRLRWQRDDLEPASGLTGDPRGGMIGDERVLVVFAGQGTSYTMYDTATGEELRRGRLDAQSRFERRAFGRRLFHFSSPETRRVRVWDPLTDSFIWDEPADQFADASMHDGLPPGTKVFSFVRDAEEAAFVTREGVLRVVDLPRGKTLFETRLEPGLVENLGFVRAFRDHERYYINLQRSSSAVRPPTPATQLISDALLPAIHIQGELCAIDRKSHTTLWTRTMGSRSVLQLADFPLPVLVTLFRVRKGEQAMLAAEVLDAGTGVTRAARDDLFSDRLLQVLYERQPGLITLRGGKTEIRVEFPDGLARIDAGAPNR